MRLALSISLLALATAANAQPMGRPMLSEACRAEVQKLCPAGGERGARRECLMTNRDKLSDGCKGELMKMREAMQKWRADRGGDMAAPGAMSTDGASPPPPPGS